MLFFYYNYHYNLDAYYNTHRVDYYVLMLNQKLKMYNARNRCIMICSIPQAGMEIRHEVVSTCHARTAELM